MRNKVIALNQSEIASVSGGTEVVTKLMVFSVCCIIARLCDSSCDAENILTCYLRNLIGVVFGVASVYALFIA